MTAGADPYVPGHGDLRWSASAYDLSLDYRPDGNRLTARATVDLTLSVDTDRIVLDLHHLSVGKVTVEGRQPARYTHRDGRLDIRLAKPGRAGQRLKVVVGYHGRPTTVVGIDGDAGWEELDDGVIVASQPHGAPSWFPCNDRPSDKARYTIAITVPKDYTAVANGVLAFTRSGASAMTWGYEQTEPMAPYLATVQIGRYAEEALPASVPMRVFATRTQVGRAVETFADQPRMLDLFADRFGPYPFPSYAVVVTDDALEIPLEAQTLSVFGSNFLSRAWEQQRLVAHELAHQWFGNSLTVAHWRDIWLHEGFACYAEWLWSEEAGVATADEQARTFHHRLSRLPQDLLLGDPGPEDMFDDRVYKRGALTLHALRRELGDARFFDVLRTWVATHAHGTVTTADFVALCGRAELIEEWVYARPLPRLPPR